MSRQPRLTEVYQIPESPEELEESKCPKCGDPNAYISFNNDVDCPNAKCPNHKGNADPLGKKGKSGSQQSQGSGQPTSWPGYPQGYKPGKDYSVHPDEGSWTNAVSQKAARICGPRWKDDIDNHQGQPGMADLLLKKLWKLGWGPDYAAEEVGFYWDLATGGLHGGGKPTPLAGYKHAQIANHDPQAAYDYARDLGMDGKTWPGDKKLINWGDGPGWGGSTGGTLDPHDAIIRPQRK